MTHATSTTTTADDAAGFKHFGLHPAFIKATDKLGFTTPTPIQARAIPEATAGRDVLGLAQTGTGKTAAFGLPLMHRLFTAKGRGTRGLILAPTRELATQIEAELRALTRFTPMQTVTIFGGVSQHGQIKGLRRHPDVIVACPGRLLDLMQQGHVHLGKIETLVLDEADQMFDMGFLPDIRRIIAELPAERQNLLFSATMPADIRGLADEILDDPLVVEVGFKGPAKTVSHALYPVDDKKKNGLLELLLGRDGVETAIVFTRTKHRAKRLALQLSKNGHRAAALQGNMSQSQRDRAMRDFRKGRFDILVATDIASRGIDVAGVSHVINYDIPGTAEAYTHRIGRTGRADMSGEAFTLVTRDDRRMVREIERKIGQPIERRMEAGFAVDIDRGGPPSGGRNRRSGQRPRSRNGRGSGGRPHGGTRGPSCGNANRDPLP